MRKAADAGEAASVLERLIADLSKSGDLIFVFGDGLTTAHLAGTTTPEFGGPANRRWWGVRLGDGAASWTMHVRVDEITGVRFFREPYPFQPHFPGQEVLGVRFLGPGQDTVLHCYVGDLYDGERMRPEKLAAWRAPAPDKQRRPATGSATTNQPSHHPRRHHQEARAACDSCQLPHQTSTRSAAVRPPLAALPRAQQS